MVLLGQLPACNDADVGLGPATTSQSSTENLVGLVERVTFHNDGNGF